MSAYTQFGYPYTTAASQLLMTGSQPTSTVAGGGGGAGGGGACCETGRVVATDPVTGQPVCSCQYEPGRLAALNSYPRLSAGSAASLHYGAAAAAAAAGYPAAGEQAPYPSIGVDSSYFGSFSNPYGLKESGGADMGVYGGLSSTAGYGYSPYDPSLYGYGAPYDLAARRKNATRESTGTLKAWLNEHKKNPYPTKGEKIMLAIITKMTLTQVSTWFANARRRLKKENKMTWEPKNKTESDEEADDSAADKEKTDKEETDGEKDSVLGNDTSDALSPLTGAEVKSETMSPSDDWKDKAAAAAAAAAGLDDCSDPQKPKIWSLADTAKCKTPPPGAGGGWPVSTAEAATTFPLPATIGPGGAPFARYSQHASQAQAQAAHSQAPPVQAQQAQAQPQASAAGYHHSPVGGGGGGGGYVTASGGGGGGYGGMAAPPPPGLSAAGYSEPQTDTPPQTPPSLKLAQLSGGGLAKLSQLGGGSALGYSGYSSAMGGAGGRLSGGLERRTDGYTSQHPSQHQQQHHAHMQHQQHQQHQQHHQQQQQQQMPLDMNSYAAAYKDGSSGSIPPAEYVSPV